MKNLFIAFCMIVVCPFSCHGEQYRITETETGITVEYTGSTEEPSAPAKGNDLTTDQKPSSPKVSAEGSSLPQEARPGSVEGRAKPQTQRDALKAQRESRRSLRQPQAASSGE